MIYRKKLSSATIVGSMLMCMFLQQGFAAVGTISTGTTHQTIEGFGGGLMFGVFPYNGSEALKNALYDSLFNKARFNVIRIGNFYNPDSAKEVTEAPMMLEIQKKWPHVKTFIASWSPPPSIKSNNSIEGKDATGKNATLKKDGSGFMYSQYADYWYKSIEYFKNAGVKIDWVSIQNEPDWPAAWDGCLLAPTEESSASYNKALDAVYNKIKPFNIPLIGPDVTGPKGLEKYQNKIDISKLSAICHHFYNGDDVASMRNVKQNYPSKPIYQTEYLINEEKNWNGSVQTWFEHLQIIHNALVEEDVSMYLLFTMAYKQASTHTCFSLDSTAKGNYSAPGGYSVRPIYYGFKHYSKSIHRNWKRIDASSDQSSLKISAFMAPTSDSVSVVVINTGTTSQKLSLKGIPQNLTTGAVYQTTQLNQRKTPQGKKYAEEGTISTADQVTLDPLSITTIEFPPQAPIMGTPATRKENTNVAGFSIDNTALFSNGMLVSFTAPVSGQYTLSLFDLSGKLAATHSGTTGADGTASTFFTGSFLKGSYALRFEGMGKSITRKVAVVN